MTCAREPAVTAGGSDDQEPPQAGPAAAHRRHAAAAIPRLPGPGRRPAGVGPGHPADGGRGALPGVPADPLLPRRRAGVAHPAGWADVISAVFRNTIIQLAVPDALRGRLSGVQMAVVAGGPRLGDFEAGAVAAAFGAATSVVSGGLACIAGAVILARLLPGFRRQRARDERHAGAEDRSAQQVGHGPDA